MSFFNGHKLEVSKITSKGNEQVIMSFKTTAKIPGRLYHHVLEGQITLIELKVFSTQFWTSMDNTEDQVDVLWEVTKATSPAAGFDMMERLGLVINQLSININPGKTAIVMDNRPEKHLVSYLVELITKNFGQREIKLFDNLQSAKDFVGYDEKR